MPAIVDHDERRRQVADITAQLIARSGIEGVTIRDVANAAGCSTRIVSHYFANKHAMLLFTYHEFSQRALTHVEEAFASAADLQGALESFLPLDEDRRLGWQVWIGFWGRVTEDPAFAAEQVVQARKARLLIRDLLRRSLPTARTGAESGIEIASARLLTTIVGIATQGVFDLGEWPAKRQSEVLAAEIKDVLAAIAGKPKSSIPG